MSRSHACAQGARNGEAQQQPFKAALAKTPKTQYRQPRL